MSFQTISIIELLTSNIILWCNRFRCSRCRCFWNSCTCGADEMQRHNQRTLKTRLFHVFFCVAESWFYTETFVENACILNTCKSCFFHLVCFSVSNPVLHVPINVQMMSQSKFALQVVAKLEWPIAGFINFITYLWLDCCCGIHFQFVFHESCY